jgi:hypothetical protein
MKPSRTKLSAVFIGSRANDQLVPKFQVALHESHTALPLLILRSSLRYVYRYYTEFQPTFTNCSASSFAVDPKHSTSKQFTLYAFEAFTLPPNYLHRKDERGQPKNFQSYKR